jgi:hypothetical protein
MAWYKAAWIPPFFLAMDTRFPRRTKASDGTIGDLTHAQGTSGHNPDDTPGVTAERQDTDSKPEVRAADVTSDLHDPDGLTMWDVVHAILAYPPDRDRLIYMICNGYIWRAATGWRQEAYSGTDKHFGHGHFSGAVAADDDGRPWPSILNLPGKATIVPSEFHTGDPNGPYLTQGPAGVSGQQRDTAIAWTWAGVTALTAKVEALTQVITTLANTISNGGGDVDTAAILAGVDERLAKLAEETRDAVADLGEGGAAQVRADAP